MTTRSIKQHQRKQLHADAFNRSMDNLNKLSSTDDLRFDEVRFKRVGSQSSMTTTTSMAADLATFHKHTRRISNKIDASYRNLSDEFHPAMKKLVKSGELLAKEMASTQMARRRYLVSLKGVRDACSKGHKETGVEEGMRDMCAVWEGIANEHDDIVAWFGTQLVRPFATNMKTDAVAVRALWHEYTEGQARIAREIKKTSKQGVDISSLTSTALAVHGARLAEAERESRARYAFVLERHAIGAQHCAAFGKKAHATLSVKAHEWSAVSSTAKTSANVSTSKPPTTTTSSSVYRKKSGTLVLAASVVDDPYTGVIDSDVDDEDAVSNVSSVELPPEMETPGDVPMSNNNVEEIIKSPSRMQRGGTSAFANEIAAHRLSTLSRGNAAATNHLATDRMPPLPQTGRLSDGMDSPQSRRHEDLPSATRQSMGHSSSVSTAPPLAVHVALHDFEAVEPNQMHLTRGDKVAIVKTGKLGWTFGRVKNADGPMKQGWFPSSYTKRT